MAKNKNNSARAEIQKLLDKEEINDELIVKTLKECLNSGNDVVKDRALDRIAKWRGLDDDDDKKGDDALEMLLCKNISVKDLEKLYGKPEASCDHCKYKRMALARKKADDGKTADKKSGNEPGRKDKPAKS